MAENKTQTPEAAKPEEKSNFIKNFVTKHPRVTKIAGITTAVVAVAGALAVAKNKKESAPTLELVGSSDDYGPFEPTETTMVAEA